MGRDEVIVYRGKDNDHQDSGDIELCIRVARGRITGAGATREEAAQALVGRGVNEHLARFAAVAAEILQADTDAFYAEVEGNGPRGERKRK